MTGGELLALCRQQGVHIGTAESCTGGMLGAALTAPPGASDVFHGGLITYSNAAKVALLGVQATTLDQFGAVSEAVALEMAMGVCASLQVDLAISITGIAGPGGSEHKPEGRVCFGVALRGQTHTETVEFGILGREQVRISARDHALSLLGKAAQGFDFT